MTTIHLAYRGKKIPITKGDDGLWRDEQGGIYALHDDAASVDDVTRLGVGVFSLPKHWAINLAAVGHDAKYSNPTWQHFHARSEADQDLRTETILVAKDSLGEFAAEQLGEIFEGLAMGHGGKFWEDETTRDK